MLSQFTGNYGLGFALENVVDSAVMSMTPPFIQASIYFFGEELFDEFSTKHATLPYLS